MPNSDWKKSIIEFLKDPIGTTNRKIRYKALSYVIIGNEFFKKTLEGVLLKCLSERESYLEIFNIDSGSCGARQECHKMKWIFFNKGCIGRLY